MRGTTCSRTYCHVSGSRKKSVTLMRMVLNSWANSSGCTSR
ncbi:MAG: CxxxxCH/CxxCH domain-containing protein [Chloroflexi bacterium]|nr:CxxxxCH/CxxCH domain-containing protein [Chloroflexota bacterium]